MLSAAAFVGFVALAVACIVTLGPLLGSLVWFTVYLVLLAIGKFVLFLTNPMRAYEAEHGLSHRRRSKGDRAY